MKIKRIILLIILLSLVFSSITNANRSNIYENINKIDDFKLDVFIVDEFGEPAENTFVTLYSYLEEEYVAKGYTNIDGKIQLIYTPDQKLFSNSTIENVHLAVYATKELKELSSWHFTQTYILDESLMRQGNARGYLDDNISELKIQLEPAISTDKEESSSKIVQFLKSDNKISKENPIYKITNKDIDKMYNLGILSLEELNESGVSISNSNRNIALSSTNLGSMLTTVGEVHAIKGASAVFKYGASSSMKIEVGIKNNLATK